MINQVTVITSLHNLMGKVNPPSGTTEDLKRYVQESFSYAWRYYRWAFSLSTAVVTVDAQGNAYLPADFDIDSYHKAIGSQLTEVSLEEATSSSSGGKFAIIWDGVADKFKVFPATGMTIVYQTLPPTLNETDLIPFPSSQVIALGATIYAKQGANPTSADVSQEWDLFHDELDRLVARSYAANTTHKAKNRYDLSGIGTGES